MRWQKCSLLVFVTLENLFVALESERDDGVQSLGLLYSKVSILVFRTYFLCLCQVQTFQPFIQVDSIPFVQITRSQESVGAIFKDELLQKQSYFLLVQLAFGQQIVPVKLPLRRKRTPSAGFPNNFNNNSKKIITIIFNFICNLKLNYSILHFADIAELHLLLSPK